MLNYYILSIEYIPYFSKLLSVYYCLCNHKFLIFIKCFILIYS